MPPKYLSDLHLTWYDTYLVEMNQSQPIPKDVLDEITFINSFTDQKMCAFRCHVMDCLYKEKIVIGDPVLHFLGMQIVHPADPGISPEFDNGLWVDVDYDPKKLADLPNDNEVLGEFNIKLFEEAVEKYSQYPGFPTDRMRDIIVEYRDNDYMVHLYSFKHPIEGIDKVKAQIDVYMNCVETWRIFSLTYRGKVLFSKEITRTKSGETLYSRYCYRIIHENDIITYHAMDPEELEWSESLVEGLTCDIMAHISQLDLKEFPEAKDFLIEKGFI